VSARALALASVAAWLGIQAFFSFAVAPVVFRVIDRAAAGDAVSAVLPRYYVWGAVLTALALVSYGLALWRGSDRRGDGVAVALCALILAGVLWAWLLVLPHAEAARRTRSDTAFVQVHRHAVELNGLTLLASAAVLVVGIVRWDRRDSR
jgi:uncharacterized protein DUF4149